MHFLTTAKTFKYHSHQHKVDSGITLLIFSAIIKTPCKVVLCGQDTICSPSSPDTLKKKKNCNLFFFKILTKELSISSWKNVEFSITEF